MTRSIQLSDGAYERLLRRSESFDDSAEDVILRLLDRAEAEGEQTGGEISAKPRRSSRARPGSILPEKDYWGPILEVLSEMGGSGHANDVMDVLEARLRGKLTERDFETLKIGEVRWRNRVRFARLRMKEHGLLSESSPRGIWQITDSGRRYLAGDLELP